MGLQIVAQPCRGGRWISLSQRPVQIVHLRAQRLVKAPGIDITQAVGGEVSEKPHGPVDILQDAVGGFVDRIAEIGFKAVIPCRLKIFDVEITRHKRAFQIKAQHDVQIVLNFVGFRPDIAAMHAIDGPVKRVFVRHAYIAKPVAHLPIEPPAIGPAAAQLIFVDARLAFMHAHRDTRPKRRHAIRRIYALLIAGMPGFMDR